MTEVFIVSNIACSCIVHHVPQEFGFSNAQLYLYGNGLCLSWDEGTQMVHTLEDTWELALTYTQTPSGYG